MDSDRAMGVGIILAIIVIAVLYFGPVVTNLMGPNYSFWWGFQSAVNTVVSVALLVLLGIGAWIGWTMASTPSPEAIEDEDFEDFETEEDEEPAEEDEEE